MQDAGTTSDIDVATMQAAVGTMQDAGSGGAEMSISPNSPRVYRAPPVLLPTPSMYGLR
jgi:hypothetical protein